MSRGRIGIVCPRLDAVGGQAVQARLLVSSLRADGYEVVVVPIDPPVRGPLAHARKIPFVRTALNQLRYLPSLSGLRDVDVVHVFAASYWSFVLAPLPAIAAARRFRRRVVLHYHSGEADDHLARYGVAVHPWLARVDQIVVPSEYLRGVFASHGYTTKMIPNIIDADRFVYRERAPLQARLLSTRNLEPYYRVDNTIEALALLRQSKPEATLWIAGDGSERPRLERTVAERKLGGVQFHGFVDNARIASLYDQRDVFLNSSVLDNQPVSLLEAFAAGLPVVTTAPGDVASMVRNGETGLIVPPADPAAMADAVTALIDDAPRALALVRAAREAVRSYSWASVRDAWAEAYGL